MIALIIIGVLLGILVLILLIPVGVDVGYENAELHASAKVMGILLQLYPRKPPDPNRPPREKKEKKKKEKPPQEEEEKPKKKRSLNFDRDEILGLVRSALGGFGKFGRKVKVERFVLRYVAAGRDPYNTAMAYGYANAVLASLSPLCRRRFRVKDCDVSTAVDFTTEEMHLDLGLAMTIRIGQILGVALGIGFGALKILIRNKLRLRREGKNKPQEPVTPEEALKASAEMALTGKNEEKTDETIQAEERKNSNG